MVVEHVHHDPRHPAPFAADPGAAGAKGRMGFSVGVDCPVQAQPLSEPRGQVGRGGVEGPFDEIAHQPAQAQQRVGAGEDGVGEVVHGGGRGG
ncbi:hypothetical protein SDC9_192579 [bioreactor metagenome]|uniref:Uncharacterized protein n=1 Tax=bioreactor metagenome TaxID=1076179 RepID=A0A645I2N0_9ZZZZ